MQSLRSQHPEAKSAVESAVDFALRLEREEEEREEMRRLDEFLRKRISDRQQLIAD